MGRAARGCAMVFAKAPVAGAVKSRLSPPLSPSDAAELHRRMIRHTLNTASRADLAAIELHCTPDVTHAFFKTCQAEFPISLKRQVDGDLGEKMRAALAAALIHYDFALLVGTDCPSITPSYLHAAAENLNEGSPVVFGPAEDGGYGLVGLRQTVPDIFRGVPWGTATVMESTRRILSVKNLAWSELTPIWDVDRPADLARLTEDSELNYLAKGLLPTSLVL